MNKSPVRVYCLMLLAGHLTQAQAQSSNEAVYRDVHDINHITNRPYTKPVAEARLIDPKLYETMPAVPKPQIPEQAAPKLADEKLRDSVDPKSKAVNLLRSEATPDEEQYVPYPSKFSLMAFFTVSVGNFEETSSNEVTVVETQQNSPGTLGLFANYRPRRASYSWQGSAYVSKLTAGVTNYAQPINPPLELGTNLYWQYETENFIPSFGVDYERFSNFSADSIYTPSEPAMVTNQSVTFATVGVARFFPVGHWNLLAKLSLSNSVTASEFAGQKAMFYLGLFTSSKWQFHALYKIHRLENDLGSKLNIGRMGIGFGYQFF